MLKLFCSHLTWKLVDRLRWKVFSFQFNNKYMLLAVFSSIRWHYLLHLHPRMQHVCQYHYQETFYMLSLKHGVPPSAALGPKSEPRAFGIAPLGYARSNCSNKENNAALMYVVVRLGDLVRVFHGNGWTDCDETGVSSFLTCLTRIHSIGLTIHVL